jgi:hypothetical protein
VLVVRQQPVQFVGIVVIHFHFYVHLVRRVNLTSYINDALV